MADWWGLVVKAVDFATGVRKEGDTPRGRPHTDGALASRGLMGGVEERLAGVLVSALHEAFNRDSLRMEAEREQAAAERARAETMLRLEIARQDAERQLSQIRIILAIDVLVWLASVAILLVYPMNGTVSRALLALAWMVLTVGVGLAFLAHHKVSAAAWRLALPSSGSSSHASPVMPDGPPRLVGAASWMTVGGLGLVAGSLIAAVGLF